MNDDVPDVEAFADAHADLHRVSPHEGVTKKKNEHKEIPLTRSHDTGKSQEADHASPTGVIPADARQDTRMRGLVVYPFKLREDCWVEVRLPAVLTPADYQRLVGFLRTLVLEDGQSTGMEDAGSPDGTTGRDPAR